MLKIINLKKEYKINKTSREKIFDDLNLELDYGEFVCILGESGCGKSTLMNLIGGLDLDYKGLITIDGKNLKNINLDDYRRNDIGFVFQNYNLIPNITVFENILLVLDMMKGSKIKKRIKVKKMLNKLGLTEVSNKRPNELSGGQKQRVAIARALIREPKIILCDEPTGALDYDNSKMILEILSDIAKQGRLVIVVTHSKKVIDYSTKIIEFTKRNEYVEEKIRDPYKGDIFCFNKSKKLGLFSCFNISLNNIFKNLKRNFLISIGSSIGIIGIILTMSLGSGVKKYVKNEINTNMDPLTFDVKKKNINELYDSYYYSNDDINSIKKINGVKKINKSIIISSNSLITYNEEKYDLVSLSSINNISEIKLKNGTIDKNGIFISEYLADKISKNLPSKNLIGNDISLYIVDNSKKEPFIINVNLKIAGIIKKSNIDLIENSSYAYISYDKLKDIYLLNGKSLYPNNLSIKINKKDDIDKVKKEFLNMDFEIVSKTKFEKEIYNYLDIITIILSLFCSISLIVSIIMITIVMYINVIERTKEIGILRSIGLRKKDIRRIFTLEAFIIGIFIGLFSSVLSINIGSVFDDILNNMFKIKIISIDIEYILFGIFISIIVVVLATISPSKKASKIDPIKALRYEL